MIKHSFIFLDRIGQRFERRLWEEGVLTWDQFCDAERIKGISGMKKMFLDRKLAAARTAIEEEDASFFADQFPFQESWRLYDEFKDDAVFLDIETADYYGSITVIGLYDGQETKMMIRGFNLNKDILEQELKKYKLIITFNGASFDLPIIRRYFGNIIPKIPHIDLRGVCSRIGLVGGLKRIEQEIGIKRPDDLLHVYGDDAVWLWHKFKETQDMKYLDTLIRYNEEDIINLKPLAEFAIPRLWKKTFLMRDTSLTGITQLRA
ncbi:MAG: ribonuclease H-like domain-containing protein [Nanoarchaeota archaeon]